MPFYYSEFQPTIYNFTIFNHVTFEIKKVSPNALHKTIVNVWKNAKRYLFYKGPPIVWSNVALENGTKVWLVIIFQASLQLNVTKRYSIYAVKILYFSQFDIFDSLLWNIIKAVTGLDRELAQPLQLHTVKQGWFTAANPGVTGWFAIVSHQCCAAINND